MATPDISSTELEHYYYAQAFVLDAAIEHPVREKTGRQAQVDLPIDGKYQFQSAKPFQLFGVLSYRSGYTQVAGHKSPKGHGHVTLATSVVEDLNVFDVVTADRVVGQVSTEHPHDGHVPHVTFLGTRFVNLRIGGHKVDVEQDLNILGPKPARDKSYLEDAGVLSRMSQQYATIRKTKGLPDWADDQFRKNKNIAKNGGELSCSLVKKITGAPGIAFGHVIDLPNFGKIFLAELTLHRKIAPNRQERDAYHFKLTMIRLEMGCIGTGKAQVAALDTNGKGGKGGGG